MSKRSDGSQQQLVVLCLTDDYDDPAPDMPTLRGECAECGAGVMYRTHTPEGAVKVCLHCGLDMMRRQAARDGGVEMGVTAETMQDLIALGVVRRH